MNTIASYAEGLSHFFFPFQCRGCGMSLDEHEHLICDHCRNHLPTTKYWMFKENPVERIFWGKIPLVRATSYLHFTKGGIVQGMLHALKYNGALEVGEYLGHRFGRELRSGIWNDIDLIVPVPLHPKKLKKRGYNQCEPIVQGMAEEMNVPYRTDVLHRRTANSSQTRKGRYDRWLNVKELFEASDDSELHGKHVLIVDDVVTTGAAIEACAAAALEIDDVRVSLATIACPSIA